MNTKKIKPTSIDTDTTGSPSVNQKLSPQKVKQARRENPGLHALYVRKAVQHILALNTCVDLLGKFSNIHLLDAQMGLNQARDHLIDHVAAYADANEILHGIQHHLKEGLRYNTRLTKEGLPVETEDQGAEL